MRSTTGKVFIAIEDVSGFFPFFVGCLNQFAKELALIDSLENGISVCLFGSADRSSSDRLSDRDVLVTAKSLKRARPHVQELENTGASVALFSHARLERMSAAGSLFVQHLKMEGKIIQDAGHWLEDCLNDFSPKNSYEEDINRSFDLIRPLERIMNENSGRQLASDLGYVFMRNYAICRLASRKVYLFDYRSLLEELKGAQRFSDRCLNKLIDLREGKHAYRAGILRVAAKNLGYGVASSIAEACPELNLEPISNGTGIRLFSLPYATLRDCEAALISKADDSGRAETYTRDLDRVRRLIKKPREYSWQIRSIDEQWIASANNLIWGDEKNTAACASESAAPNGSDAG